MILERRETSEMSPISTWLMPGGDSDLGCTDEEAKQRLMVSELDETDTRVQRIEVARICRQRNGEQGPFVEKAPQICTVFTVLLNR